MTTQPPTRLQAPVRYFDGITEVRLGDVITTRVWGLWKRTGRVVYVPGLSAPHGEFERDRTAHAEAEHVHAIEAQVVEHAEHVAGEGCTRERPVEVVGVPVPLKLHRDHPAAGRQPGSNAPN